MFNTNNVTKIKNKAPRMHSEKDYSDFSVEGRKGRPESRKRRQDRDNKRNWETL